MGDEVGHLEQVVRPRASEGGAADVPICGDLLGPLAVVPRLVPAGTRGCGSRACDRRGAARGKIQRKLGDDSDNPTYIFTEPRVGYRMPKGDVGPEYPVSALQLEPANRGITFVAKVSRFLRVLLNGIPMCVNSTSR